MNKCLLGKNLQIQYVNGAGNCFFHALVESLPDNKKAYVLKNYGSNYWVQFRVSTIEWLKKKYTILTQWLAQVQDI